MQIPPNFKRRSVISLIRKHSRLWLILGRPFEKGPSLLPADYCQRGLPFTSSGGRTELVWKHDIRLGCKGLRLKAKHADQIHYVHLGKLAVVKASNRNKGLADFRSEPQWPVRTPTP